MAYSDKEKQKQANRERQRRYKAKQKALLLEGVTAEALPDNVTPKIETIIPSVIPDIGAEPESPYPVIPCNTQVYGDSHPEIKKAAMKLQSFNPMMVGYVPPRGNEKVNR